MMAMMGLSKPAALGLSIGFVIVSAGCAAALDLNGAWAGPLAGRGRGLHRAKGAKGNNHHCQEENYASNH